MEEINFKLLLTAQFVIWAFCMREHLVRVKCDLLALVGQAGSFGSCIKEVYTEGILCRPMVTFKKGYAVLKHLQRSVVVGEGSYRINAITLATRPCKIIM